MNVKDRLKQYLKSKQVTQNTFCKSVGVSQAYVTNIRKSISPEIMANIAKQFPDLNITWLLTGQGPMLNDEKLPTPDVSAQKSIVGDGNHHNNIGNGDDSFWKKMVQTLQDTITDLRARCSTYEQQNQELQRLLEEEKKRNFYGTMMVDNK